MDDSLRALEEKLEDLVPKGLSDLGRERMEDQIDELAASLEDGGSGGGWKWGIGAVAALVAMVVALWSPEEQGGAGEMVSVPEVTPVVAVIDEVEALPIGMEFQEGMDFEEYMVTLSYQRQVESRKDQGWVKVDGVEIPHRYWSYGVRDEEEFMDELSGYEVRVVSEHETWVPVKVTSL